MCIYMCVYFGVVQYNADCSVNVVGTYLQCNFINSSFIIGSNVSYFSLYR